MTIAKFLTQQQPVKIFCDSTNVTVHIYANERITDDSITDSETGTITTVSYYEYDYNEFTDNKNNIDVNNILAYPENYIDYIPVNETERNKELQDAVYALARLQADSLSDETALTVKALYDDWKSNMNFVKGKRYLHHGVLYKCLNSHDGQPSWSPDVSPSLFAKVLIPDSSVITEWVQPESTNGYKIGDKVSHAGYIWISLVNNNTWEPGIIGTETIWKKEE